MREDPPGVEVHHLIFMLFWFGNIIVFCFNASSLRKRLGRLAESIFTGLFAASMDHDAQFYPLRLWRWSFSARALIS